MHPRLIQASVLVACFPAALAFGAGASDQATPASIPTERLDGQPQPDVYLTPVDFSIGTSSRPDPAPADPFSDRAPKAAPTIDRCSLFTPMGSLGDL